MTADNDHNVRAKTGTGKRAGQSGKTAGGKDKRPARTDAQAATTPKADAGEAKAQRGKLGPTNRVKFQVIAFLVREERARVKADDTLDVAARAELLKRLDGVATILAKTAARDTSLIQLLEVDQATSPMQTYFSSR